MEAMILAAGLGTRLRPLTDVKPKALVAVNGVPMLELIIEKMSSLGVNRIVVNTFHFAEQIEAFVASRRWRCPIVISDERPLLRDTGGALSLAGGLFSGRESVVVHNVDVMATFNIEEMYEQHQKTKALVTLATSSRSSSRQLLVGEENRLVGWCNKSTGERLLTNKASGDYRELAFSGITIVEPQLFSLLPSKERSFPVVPEYLRLADSHNIVCFEHEASQWCDIGKLDSLHAYEQSLRH